MAHTKRLLGAALDGTPYLDKPIVYFAAAAAVMELLGPTRPRRPARPTRRRSPPIASWVGFARRRWGPDAGWLAGIAYATTLLPLVYARTASSTAR